MRKFSKQLLSLLLVCRARFFGGSEGAKTDGLIVVPDAGLERAIRLPCDPLDAGLVGGRQSRISAILRACGLPEICNPIVILDAIYVVNVVRRIYAVDVLPSKPVGAILSALNLNVPVATAMGGASYFSRGKPCELTRTRGVMEQVFQICNHRGSLLMIGRGCKL